LHERPHAETVPPHGAREPFGWLPAPTVLHVPVASHAWHCPVHALLQHTPSTQKLDAHSVFAEHACPFSFSHVPHVDW
jgi:hypothetical protein